jgi:predicted DNA-binding protein
MPSPERRVPVSVRVSPEVARILHYLQMHTGWNKTSVIESAIKISGRLRGALF